MDTVFDAMSESGSTAEWVNVHASIQSPFLPRSLSGDESNSISEGQSEEQLLVAAGTCQLPVYQVPQLSDSSRFNNSPIVSGTSKSFQIPDDTPSSLEMTEGGSLVAESVQSRRAELKDSQHHISDETQAQLVLEATQPLAMEAALQCVWDGSVRRIFTDKGRIVNLDPDDIVLKARDLLQRLIALLCRDIGRCEGKQAAADMIAWMCADSSCGRALQKPSKIISLLVGMVCEDEPEIRRNVMRAIRNLVQQSIVYAEALVVPEKLDRLVETRCRRDSTLCVYFAETVASLVSHFGCSELSKRVCDTCLSSLLQMISASLEADPVAAVLDAVKSLAVQPYAARLIWGSPVLPSICVVTTSQDVSVQKAAVELLNLLLQGELKQDTLWELMSEKSLLGLFNVLKMGNTEIETLVLKLLTGHPKLVGTNLIGHSQLADIESILQYGNFTCQDHAIALLLKLVQEGLDEKYFISNGVNMVCTLIGLTIGDNKQVKSLALETLQQLVERESGEKVAEVVVQYDGIGVMKYLLQENAVGNEATLGPILSLLRSVSRLQGANTLIRSEGIVQLMVENLKNAQHVIDILDYLHHLFVQDPQSMFDVTASGDSQKDLLKGISDALATTNLSALEQAKTHPLEVLLLLLSDGQGCSVVIEKASEWVHILMGFTGDENGRVKDLALECMKRIVNNNTPLRLALDLPSLRFISSLLTSKEEDMLMGLRILAGCTNCTNQEVLEQSRTYAILCQLLNDATNMKDMELRLMILKAVAQVSQLNVGACARELIQQNVQNVMWTWALDYLQGLSLCHITAILSLLKAVGEQEVKHASKTFNDLRYLSLEHRLELKETRIVLLQSKLEEQFETIKQQNLSSSQAEQLLAEMIELCQHTTSERDQLAEKVASLEQDIEKKDSIIQGLSRQR